MGNEVGSKSFHPRAHQVGVLRDVIAGIRLEPRVWVEVDSGGEDGKVTFTSTRASLGNTELDTNFQLSMSSSLTGHTKVCAFLDVDQVCVSVVLVVF